MNQLQDESSPYLLQHAQNPVHWFTWSPAAFHIAQAQDKPILLSIGYSACHWCHVMAHESFEDDETAALMNALYINIKVDREERPDVDDIYMQAVQALSGQGGWPLTVFLLPDGRPFYGGTYFPKTPRYGMPSFTQLLQAVHDAFRSQRDQLEQQASHLHRALQRDILQLDADHSALSIDLLQAAAEKLLASIDRVHGGFGAQPKFPNPISWEFLLRQAHWTGDKQALDMLRFSLRAMARGGIYDQIGGGFARYSVDERWLVPHFEKMLYDNALLSRLYLHAWQKTGDPFLRDIATDIIDYILREMTAPEGGFYSATDADSEGVEGKFFLWTIDEVRAALSPLSEQLPKAADIAIERFGMSAAGNFEGKNILHCQRDLDEVAGRLQLPLAALKAAIPPIKHALFAARAQRIPPALDDKIISAWNGMMLASLAEAARVLQRADYLDAACRSGDFFLQHLLDGESRLFRIHKDGKSTLNAYLEDYAHCIDAMLELYQSTFEPRWFQAAQDMATFVLAHFRADDGGFYDTSDDHEQLIVRPRNLQDNVTASGNAMMARQLLRLAAYTSNTDYAQRATETLASLSAPMREYPQAFAESLQAVDMLVRGIDEIAIIGERESAPAAALFHVLQIPYRPNQILAWSAKLVQHHDIIPLLSSRPQIAGQTAVYVCRNFACRLPVNSAEALEQLLSGTAS